MWLDISKGNECLAMRGTTDLTAIAAGVDKDFSMAQIVRALNGRCTVAGFFQRMHIVLFVGS